MQAKRDVVESKRQAIFKSAFIDVLDAKVSKTNKTNYLMQLQKDLGEEIEIYQGLQNNVINQFKNLEAVWIQSSGYWLEKQEVSFRKTIEFAMSSPLTFSGEQSSLDILKIYQDATALVRPQFTSADIGGFKALLDEIVQEDDEEKLLFFDYLVCDYVRHSTGLSSTKFKTAISAYELLEIKAMKDLIQSIVDDFTVKKWDLLHEWDKNDILWK